MAINMKIKHTTKRKLVHYGIIAALIAALLGIALAFVNAWEKNHGVYEDNTPAPPTETETTVAYDGKEYVVRDGIETVLVVGLDAYEMNEDDEYYNNQQSDFLMLLVLDNNKKECGAIQINRDTMTDVNILGIAGQFIESRTMQIALSHSYGNGELVSLRNTADAVSGLLHDMKIDCSVAVTMEAVGVLNDKVGGVEVEILDDFSEVDSTLIEGEKIKLTGDQALTYVRGRGSVGDGTNISRMERQRQYLNALFDEVKAKSAEDSAFIADSAAEISDYFAANTTTDSLVKAFEKVTDYTFTGIRTIDGKSVVGEKYMEFYPDGTKLTGLIVELFCEEKK